VGKLVQSRAGVVVRIMAYMYLKKYYTYNIIIKVLKFGISLEIWNFIITFAGVNNKLTE
jgi:hypothetical protein